MTWLLMAVAAGFFNALWTALSKPVLARMTSREFTLCFRTLTCLFLLPFALAEWTWSLPPSWWGWVSLAAFCEGLRIWFLSKGVKRDYYSTYAFYNLSPFFTVLVAPLVIPEPQSGLLVAGGVVLAVGSLVFYHLGHWSWPGLAGAVLSTAGVIAAKLALGLHPAPLLLAFWSFGLGAVALAPLEALGGRRLRWDSMRREARHIVPIAFWSLVASLLFYVALAHADASKVNPLVRANLLFGFLFSYYLLKERGDWRGKAVGGALILVGLALVAVS
jgi:uncharacterized membrane protein